MEFLVLSFHLMKPLWHASAGTEVANVMRQIRNLKVWIPAPLTVSRYNRFMGGVVKHDKLHSTFYLGKQHKLKKYYVKLLLFLVDIALTNSWLYYKLVHEDITQQGEEARADFFLSVAQAMVCQNTDWELKYKQRHERTTRSQRNSDDSDSVDAYLPGRNVHHETTINATINTDVCQPCAFNVVPYELHKKVRTVKSAIMR
jgi:hypothetical protein